MMKYGLLYSDGYTQWLGNDLFPTKKAADDWIVTRKSENTNLIGVIGIIPVTEDPIYF